MKAIAYSIKPLEKTTLALANGKKHDLTLISNELNVNTVSYAQGKEAVIVSVYDILDDKMLEQIKNVGVNKIITRSNTTTHIDLKAATRMGFKIANVPYEDQSIENVAKQTIHNLNAWDSGKCAGNACCCQKICALDKKKVTDETVVVNPQRYRYSHGGK